VLLARKSQLQERKAVLAPGEMSRTNTTFTPDKKSRSFCIEAMPANVKLLNKVSAAVLQDYSITSFTVINAAASNSSGTTSFPNYEEAPGAEDIGMNNNGTGHSTRKLVDVKMVTVDELMEQHGLTSLDVLTIDTEGADPSVIQGASKVLSGGHVRYLVFEVHQDLGGTAWSTTSLLSQIELLDGMNFDCYWATNDGHLSRLTGCWDELQEAKHHPVRWSNVACVNRGDEWHAVLERYAS